jgi:protoporphyrinogen oxidase
MNQHYRYLIIGAGITGLAFANRLESDDYLILEGEDEIGGYCRTVKQDGFIWDYSGHFFHFKHPHIKDYLVSRMKEQRILEVRKDSRIHYQGQLIDFPFQKNIHQLPKEDFLDCLYHLYFRDSSETPTNFSEMLYSEFGRGIADRFLIPYNEKLYATDLANLDVAAMGRFFPHADMSAIIRNFKEPDNESYNSTFTYPEGGAIQYVEALARDLDPARIALHERVDKIDVHHKQVTTNQRVIGYDYLISSAPFLRLLELCDIPFDPAVYDWNKVLVFNLGFDSKGLSGVHWIYFPERSFVFYRIGFYDNIFDTERMSIYVEIGYPKDAVLDEQAIASARGQVLVDLRRSGLVTETQRLVASHSVLLDPAYVHVTQSSIADVASRRRMLAAAGIFSAGRYGSWTYCSIEDNILEANALASDFNALDTLAPMADSRGRLS